MILLRHFERVLGVLVQVENVVIVTVDGAADLVLDRVDHLAVDALALLHTQLAHILAAPTAADHQIQVTLVH